MFRSRDTGRITVAQVPNWQLSVWFVAFIALRIGQPHGALRDGLRVIATVALGAWAIDEILRGVNPFRRLVGTGVLAALLVSVARTLT
jgi:hypothetical protein